jgi:hypothetical protein
MCGPIQRGGEYRLPERRVARHARVRTEGARDGRVVASHGRLSVGQISTWRTEHAWIALRGKPGFSNPVLLSRPHVDSGRIANRSRTSLAAAQRRSRYAGCLNRKWSPAPLWAPGRRSNATACSPLPAGNYPRRRVNGLTGCRRRQDDILARWKRRWRNDGTRR